MNRRPSWRPSRRMPPRFSLRFSPRLALRPLAVALALCHGPAVLAQALPHGATVHNGTAVINSFSNGLQVINTPGAVLHWQGFSIGNGRTVRFDQVNAQSAVLNRVTGNAHSEILGTLQSNGRVFLLNPNGIVFGAGAVVDTAGLIASTLNISDEDFLAGTYRFTCFNAIACEAGVDVLNPHNNRIVLKDGSRITTRTAGEGGQVWLIARDRITSEKGSRIDAPTGQVMAAAAREVTVTSPSLGQMSFTLTGTSGSRVDLAGDIDVARGAAGFFADTVRLAGIVSARSDVNAAGQITAHATREIVVDGDARLDVSGTDGADAGAVRLKAVQKITVHPNSDINADSGLPTAQHASPRGGLIELDAYQVNLPWRSADMEILAGYFTASDRPAVLHAYAQGAAEGDFSRTGKVDVRESGSFSFEAIDVDLGISNRDIYGVYPQTVETPKWVIPAGDGSLLVISQRTFTGANFDEHHTWYRARVVGADGQLLSSAPIDITSTPLDGLDVRMIEVRPLSQGGWVLGVGGYESPTSFAHKLVVLDARGAETARIASPATAVAAGDELSRDAFMNRLQAVRGGGFAITTSEQGVERTRLYTASGQLDVNADPALAAQRVAAQQVKFQNVYGSGNYVRFNQGLQISVETSVDQHTRSATITDPTGAVVATTRLPPQLAEPYLLSSPIGMLTPYAWLANQWETVNPDLTRHNHGVIDAQGQFIAPIGSTSYGIDPVHGEGTGGSQRVMALGTHAVVALAGGTYVDPDSLVQTELAGMRILQSRPLAMPFAATNGGGSVLASPLLASMPGQSNGTAGGGTQPPVDPGPGTQPPAPGRQSDAQLPPPVYFPSTRAPNLEIARAPITIPASTVTDTRTQAEIDAEILADAERLVREYMGPQDAARFAAAKNDEERRPFMKEVGYAMLVGQDIYDATRSLGEEMRGAMFNGWGEAQVWGLEDDEDFGTGLMKAMTEKLPAAPNEDGSPGVPRTRLQAAFDVMELELKQAQTKDEKERIGRRVFREMVHAAREASGKDVDPDADLVLPDGNGGSVRINDEGDVVHDKAG